MQSVKSHLSKSQYVCNHVANESIHYVGDKILETRPTKFMDTEKSEKFGSETLISSKT